MKIFRLPQGFWWSVGAALLAFIISIWWFPPRPDREWPVPDLSRVVGFYDKGKAIATWEQVKEGKLSLWDCQTGQLRAEVPAGAATGLQCDFSPDARYVAYSEKTDSGWRLRVRDLTTDQRDQDLIIRLPERMNKLVRDSLVTIPRFSEDGNRLIFREEDSQGYWSCLWDLRDKRLIHRQQHGFYNDSHFVVRWDRNENQYSIWDATTGKLLARLPALPTATEFEFSAESDGSAFMILGGSNEEAPRLIKYRFELATQRLTTMWEQKFTPGQHTVRYEFRLRPPQAYLIKERVSTTPYLLDAKTGQHQALPYDLPFAAADIGRNSLRFDFGDSKSGDSSICAVDAHGTRAISPNGKYLVYVVEEDFTGFKAWLDEWLTKAHLPLSRNSRLVVVDVLRSRMVDDFRIKSPFADFASLMLHFAPSSQQIALVNYKSQQAYLQLWSIPFPSRPWWLIGLISIASGEIVRRSVLLYLAKKPKQ